jgi:hypothetical protein
LWFFFIGGQKMTRLNKIVLKKINLQSRQELVQKLKNNHNIKIQFLGEGISRGSIKNDYSTEKIPAD